MYQGPRGSHPARYGVKMTEPNFERPDRDADEEREVPLVDDNDIVILPDQTSDDQPDYEERREGSDDDLLIEDRPPHWDA